MHITLTALCGVTADDFRAEGCEVAESEPKVNK